MKIERTRDLQADRIDRQKLDNVIFAQKGERPEVRDGRLLDDTAGLFIRRNGKWRQIGLSQGQVAEVADEQIAAAPAAPIRRADILETVDIGNSRDASVEFYYDILEKDLEDEESLPTSFSVEFYASSAHFEAKTPQIPEAQRPNAIIWTPTEPYQTLGTHIEKLEFYIRSTEYNPIYLNIVVE